MSNPIDIKVNGVVVGSVDPKELPGRAQFDLEDARGAYDVLEWLHKYAGVSEAELPRVRDELADMPVQAIIDLMQAISAAIGEALTLPNASGPTWRQRSSTTATRRSGR